MKKRKMTAKQLKYFGPRKRKTRKVIILARKRKSGFRRTASRGIGGIKPMISPILGGVADSYLDGMLAGTGLPVQGVGATAVGMFMHNETIKNIGLYKVGFSLGNILPLPGKSSGGSGTVML